MKVLWFSNTPSVGIEHISKNAKIKGTGGWIYSLDQRIQNHVKLHIAFHYPYKIPPFQYGQTKYYPVYTGNIIIENLKKRFLGKVYDRDFLQYYLSIIEEVKPDIIHIHGTENSFLCLLDMVTIPIVISIQGNPTVIQHKFKGAFLGKYLFNRVGKINIKTIAFGRRKFNNDYNTLRQLSFIEQKYLGKAKYILGRTSWDKRITRVLSPHRKYFLGNEMLRDKFYESTWDNTFHMEDNKLIIFTTNGNTYYKGLETACYALHILNNLNIEVEWRVAGVSEDSLIHKIVKKALKEKHPKKGLKLLGSLNESELISNLQDAHMYVMPSHIENSPNSLCEAMLLGMPCIATFAGGAGSILKDGEDGILIQDGDPWAMAGAILELAEDAEKAKHYSRSAKEKALLRHDRERIIQNLILVYKEIINEH